MARAYHNVTGWVRDIRALREAAHGGDREAGSLLDAVCDELDVLLDFGSEDDEFSDSGHAEGSGDPEDMAEGELDPPSGGQQTLPAVGAGTRRVSSSRGGARTAVLTQVKPVAVRMGQHGKES